jgi:hypothetical protein
MIAAALTNASELKSGGQPPIDPIVKDVPQMLAMYPNNVKLLFENDYVWVLEYRLEPGDALPVHDLGNHAVYALSDYRLLALHSYEPSVEGWTTGKAAWYRCEPQEVTNIGNTPARYLAVARKPFPLDEARRIVHDDWTVRSPQPVQELIANPQMRIMEIVLAPGEIQPVHQGLHRVVYSLTNYQIRMAGSEYQFRPGDIHFHGPGEHAVENTGRTPARYLVFEMRK